MPTLWFIAVSVLLATSTAFADRPIYTRKQRLEIDVKLSTRVKPIQPATAPRRQPVVTAADVLVMQRTAEPIRREQEAILIKLIEDTPDSDADKPEYMFRLAELYAQQLRFWRLEAIAPTIRSRR